jgi:hypothetical protein
MQSFFGHFLVSEFFNSHRPFHSLTLTRNARASLRRPSQRFPSRAGGPRPNVNPNPGGLRFW